MTETKNTMFTTIKLQNAKTKANSVITHNTAKQVDEVKIDLNELQSTFLEQISKDKKILTDNFDKLLLFIFDLESKIYSIYYGNSPREEYLYLYNELIKLLNNCLMIMLQKKDTNDLINNIIDLVNNTNSNKKINLQSVNNKSAFIMFVSDVLCTATDIEKIKIKNIYNELFKKTRFNVGNLNILPNSSEENIKKYIICKLVTNGKCSDKLNKYFSLKKEKDKMETSNFFNFYLKNSKFEEIKFFIKDQDYFNTICDLFLKNETNSIQQSTDFINFFINVNNYENLKVFIQKLINTKNKEFINKYINAIMDTLLSNHRAQIDFDNILNGYIKDDNIQKILIKKLLETKNESLRQYVFDKINKKVITIKSFTKEELELFTVIFKDKINDIKYLEDNKDKDFSKLKEKNEYFYNKFIEKQKCDTINFFSTQYINELFIFQTILNWETFRENEEIKSKISQNKQIFIKSLLDNCNYFDVSLIYQFINDNNITNEELLNYLFQNQNIDEVAVNTFNRINYKHLSRVEKIIFLKLINTKQEEIEDKFKNMNVDGKINDIINSDSLNSFAENYLEEQNPETKKMYGKFFFEKMLYCASAKLSSNLFSKVFYQNIFVGDISSSEFTINETNINNFVNFANFFVEYGVDNIKTQSLLNGLFNDTSFDITLREIESLNTKIKEDKNIDENKKELNNKINFFIKNHLPKILFLDVDNEKFNQEYFCNMFVNFTEKLFEKFNGIYKNCRQHLEEQTKNNVETIIEFFNRKIASYEKKHEEIMTVKKEERLKETKNIELDEEIKIKMELQGKAIEFKYNQQKYKMVINTTKINTKTLYKIEETINPLAQEKSVESSTLIKNIQEKQKILSTLIDRLYIQQKAIELDKKEEEIEFLNDVNEEFDFIAKKLNICK